MGIPEERRKKKEKNKYMKKKAKNLPDLLENNLYFQEAQKYTIRIYSKRSKITTS